MIRRTLFLFPFNYQGVAMGLYLIQQQNFAGGVRRQTFIDKKTRVLFLHIEG